MLHDYIRRIDRYLNHCFSEQTIMIAVMLGSFLLVSFGQFLIKKYFPSNRNRCPWCGALQSRPLPLFERRFSTLGDAERCTQCKHLFRVDMKIWTWLCYAVSVVVVIYCIKDDAPFWWGYILLVFCLCPEVLFGHLYGYPLQKDFESGMPHCEGIEKRYVVVLQWESSVFCPIHKDEIYPICFVNEAGLPQSKMICVRLGQLQKMEQNNCKTEISFLLYGLPVPKQIATFTQFYLYRGKKKIGEGRLCDMATTTEAERL